MKTKIIQNTKTIILGCIVALGVGYVSADWAPPSVPPTGGNMPAPITVGTTTASIQEILGTLGMNNLIVANSFQFTGGTPTAGQVLTALDSSGMVGWRGVSGGMGNRNIYSVIYDTQITTNTTDWTDTGLSLTVTPSSSNSEFLINANIIAVNNSASGNCDAGLFKDSTELVVPFSSSDNTGWSAVPYGVSYVDPAGSTSSRTYKVKVRNYCYINRSEGSTSYVGKSTMTILEI